MHISSSFMVWAEHRQVLKRSDRPLHVDTSVLSAVDKAKMGRVLEVIASLQQAAATLSSQSSLVRRKGQFIRT